MNRFPVIVRQHIAAFRALLVFTVLCGLIYPAVLVGISQGIFHNHANGSTVSYNGRTVGSSLLCQEFADAKGNPLPKYFQPRPSNAVDATSKTDYGCNPLFSAAFNHVPVSEIPADAVTASASGLDPGISPQNAAIQVNRVAEARNLPVSEVKALVDKYTQGRTF